MTIILRYTWTTDFRVSSLHKKSVWWPTKKLIIQFSITRSASSGQGPLVRVLQEDQKSFHYITICGINWEWDTQIEECMRLVKKGKDIRFQSSSMTTNFENMCI